MNDGMVCASTTAQKCYIVILNGYSSLSSRQCHRAAPPTRFDWIIIIIIIIIIIRGQRVSLRRLTRSGAKQDRFATAAT